MPTVWSFICDDGLYEYNLLLFFHVVFFWWLAGFSIINLLGYGVRGCLRFYRWSSLLLPVYALSVLLNAGIIPSQLYSRVPVPYRPVPLHNISFIEHMAWLSELDVSIVSALSVVFTISFISYCTVGGYCLAGLIKKRSLVEGRLSRGQIRALKLAVLLIPFSFFAEKGFLKPSLYSSNIEMHMTSTDLYYAVSMEDAMQKLDQMVDPKTQKEIHECPSKFLNSYHSWLAEWVSDNWLDMIQGTGSSTNEFRNLHAWFVDRDKDLDKVHFQRIENWGYEVLAAYHQHLKEDD